jgi:hypothetical protein
LIIAKLGPKDGRKATGIVRPLLVNQSTSSIFSLGRFAQKYAIRADVERHTPHLHMLDFYHHITYPERSLGWPGIFLFISMA